MVSILSKPGFQQRAMPLSIKAWHQMIDAGLAPRRAELIRGVIVEKMSKSILHTKLAARIFALLQKLTSARLWVRKEDPLTLADSEPEPDVSVVDGSETDFQQHPTSARLVVEIAVSSLSEDRDMAEIYAEAAVAEYWIVNGPERCIEVYREPVGGRYQTQFRVVEGGVLECAALPEVRVDIAALFAGAGA
ncbi:MAG: Uma2 family endonuclease [Prosthecobacter sp.]|uniref:Uma2 family endonuclease n=1 Tax=Prosthecobacter sp. TaxID=1965333 RepID=UPI00390009E7